MTIETLETKAALKELVDTFSTLADEKRITDQMALFTPDTKVQVYMGENLLFDISGTTSWRRRSRTSPPTSSARTT
jgi:hypothetical protein